MKKVGVALLSLVFLLASCGTSAASTTSASHTPLKIGLLYEATGAFSYFGIDSLNAAQLWVKQVNAKGGVAGHKVQLITYNTATNPTQAVEGYKYLASQHVAAIVGPGSLAEFEAVAPIATSGPVLYTTCGICIPKGLLQFAGVILSGPLEAYALSQLHKAGINKVAFLSTNDATGETSYPPFAEAAKALGMDITATQYFDTTSVDVTTQLTKIMATHPQAIDIWTAGEPTVVAFQGLHALGINVPVITCDCNLIPSLLGLLQKRGILPSQLYIPITPDLAYNTLPSSYPEKAKIESFDKAYEAQFGSQPGLSSGTTYDALSLIALGVEKSHSLNPVKIAEAMQQIHGYVGLQGIYNFSPTQHRGVGESDAVLVKIVNGKPEYASL